MYKDKQNIYITMYNKLIPKHVCTYIQSWKWKADDEI